MAQEFSVRGNFKGVCDCSAYVTIFGSKEGSSLIYDNPEKESFNIKDGKFQINGSTKQEIVLRISLGDQRFYKMVGNGFIPVKSASLWVIVTPNSQILLEGDLTNTNYMNLYYSGDAENKILAELSSQLMPAINKEGDLTVKIRTDTTLNDTDKKEIKNEIEKLGEQQKIIRENFVKKHPSSIAALWLIEDMLIRSQIEIHLVDSLLSMINDKYKNSYFYKSVYARVQGSKNSAVGAQCPIIEGIDAYGNKLDLTMFKGKYVILDFWGTWCGACLAGMPAMKKFRDENADIVQILGISNDKNEQAWKKCIERNKMDWPNIMQGTGERDYVSKFNVQGFPTKILVGPDGKIILRVVGENEDFYLKIKEIINK
jgi:Thiol-disulfide isomerase and thioredoxins